MNLVAHGWFVEADLVRLPERGNLGEDQRFIFAGFGIGERQLVEALEISSDAAAFEANRMARDFGWVSGKDGRYFDLAQGCEHGVSRDTGGLHADQRAAE